MTTVKNVVKSNNKVNLGDFGTFELRNRAERKGRDPRTKEEMIIPACKSPTFKVGKLFKDIVNS